MRMYEQSWISLKKSEASPKRIEIIAHPAFHKRIYKAIRKEKDMDVMYKLALQDGESAKKAMLGVEKDAKNKSKLIIIMKIVPDLSYWTDAEFH